MSITTWSEASAHLARADGNKAASLATPLGHVRLLDDDRVRRTPPLQGVGGVFLGSGVPGFVPRARVGRRGFARVSAGFPAAAARKASDPDRPLGPKPWSRPDGSLPEVSDCDRPLRSGRRWINACQQGIGPLDDGRDGTCSRRRHDASAYALRLGAVGRARVGDGPDVRVSAAARAADEHQLARVEQARPRSPVGPVRHADRRT